MKMIDINSKGQIVISNVLLKDILKTISTPVVRKVSTKHCSRRACVRTKVKTKDIVR